jgi:hypothetical protein
LNSGLLDAASAFKHFYVKKQDFYQFFDFFNWDELDVNKTITGLYGWEAPEESKSTWRIGDGTASFYNLAYLYAAGFNEFDTFRANQVRSGFVSKTEGLELASEEHIPLFSELADYAETAGVNLKELLEAVLRLERRY